MDVRCSSVFTASFLVGGVHGLWRCGQLWTSDQLVAESEISQCRKTSLKIKVF